MDQRRAGQSACARGLTELSKLWQFGLCAEQVSSALASDGAHASCCEQCCMLGEPSAHAARSTVSAMQLNVIPGGRRLLRVGPTAVCFVLNNQNSWKMPT